MRDGIDPAAHIKGRVRAYDVIGDDRRLTTDWGNNDVLFDWGAIVGKLLVEGSINYRIGGMYLEYENVADPGDPVSVPSFSRSGGLSYYQGLSVSAVRDYLRVPLTASTLTSSDPVVFPQGNLGTWFAQSQGVTGTHGKAFNDAVNSKVFGGALVAFVDDADADQDIVLSRFYFSVAAQQVKLPTSQIGLEWDLELQ